MFFDKLENTVKKVLNTFDIDVSVFYNNELVNEEKLKINNQDLEISNFLKNKK